MDASPAALEGLAAQIDGAVTWLHSAAEAFSSINSGFAGLDVDGAWSGAGRGNFDKVTDAAARCARSDADALSSAASRLSGISAAARDLARSAAAVDAAAAAPNLDPALIARLAAQGVSLRMRANRLEATAAGVVRSVSWAGQRIVTNGHKSSAVLASFAAASPHHKLAASRLLELSATDTAQLAFADPLGLALIVATMDDKDRAKVLKKLTGAANAADVLGTVSLLDGIAAQLPEVDLKVVVAALASNRSAANAFMSAARYDGFVEGENNDQPFAPMVGHAPNQAWCTSFVNAVSALAGTPIPAAANDAFTETQRQAFMSSGAWIDANPAAPGAGARPGDYVYLLGDRPGLDSSRTVSHVGIVVAPLGDDQVLTIEGNARAGGGSDHGSDQGVFFHVRGTTPEMSIVGYGRPDWDTSVTPGWSAPPLRG